MWSLWWLSPPRRPLWIVGRAGEREKESARGTMGRGKRRTTFFLFPSFPARFLFFFYYCYFYWDTQREPLRRREIWWWMLRETVVKTFLVILLVCLFVNLGGLTEIFHTWKFNMFVTELRPELFHPFPFEIELYMAWFCGCWEFWVRA